MVESRRLALSSLFGLLIFFQKVLFPAPYDKLVTILLQITLLSLAFLFVGFIGPILTSSVSALLTASTRGDLVFVTFTMAMSYGFLVSSFHRVLRVVDAGRVRMMRLMMATFVSSLVMGVLSATISISFGFIPYNVVLFAAIMGTGAIQGLIGGYLCGLIWNRYTTSITSN